MKKEHGVTTFKGDPLYFGGTEDRMIYEFGFYETKRKNDKELIDQITIGLFTKAKGKDGEAVSFENKPALYSVLEKEVARDPSHTLILVKGSRGSAMKEIVFKLKGEEPI